MRILPSGSCGLLLECEDLDEVLGQYAGLLADTPDGVVDVVPAARTVLLVLDPAATTPDRVRAAVEGRGSVSHRRTRGNDRDVLEIPVVYDGADLDDVADIVGCSRDEVIARHTGELWTVAFCGFVPGFGYLTADDADWQIPRRRSPRTKVPAGSVGLAGEFTGVYPRESPGGWQLIGRTDLPPFDLDRDPPAVLSPDTRVRFVAVDP